MLPAEKITALSFTGLISFPLQSYKRLLIEITELGSGKKNVTTSRKQKRKNDNRGSVWGSHITSKAIYGGECGGMPHTIWLNGAVFPSLTEFNPRI
jgi:hypothetical protein